MVKNFAMHSMLQFFVVVLTQQLTTWPDTVVHLCLLKSLLARLDHNGEHG